VIDRFCLAVATGFHLSYIPFWLTARFPDLQRKRWTGAGHVGAALGWISLYALPTGLSLGVCLILATVFASWASGRADRVLGSHDDPRIVVDETVGFWTAAAWLPRDPWTLAGAFVLFRFFDAMKFEPYRRLERLPGGWGVVLDDVGAGIAATLLVRSVVYFRPV